MMKKMVDEFRQKLTSGETVFGPFMKTSDPAFVEATGHAGFDFAILDMEHGPVSLETMQNLVRAALLSGMVPVIRTRDRQPESISRALDIGALGIQVPQISSAGELREVLKSSRFSPLGERGVCRFVRAAGYSSIPREQYFKEANEKLIIVQLEGQKAIDNIDEILSVMGIDVFFIGPYDLSQSVGYPGQIDHPEVLKLMKELIRKARERSCALGIFADTPESVKNWVELGVGYISYSVDVGIYYSACKNLFDKFREYEN